MAPTTITALAEEKTLPSSFIRDEDERPKVAYNQFSDEIPVILLEGIDEVEGRRGEICKKIVDACEEWGIFQVVDHGVDAKLISDMAKLSREFFALPAEEKLRFDMSGGQKGGFIVSSHHKRAVQEWREVFNYFTNPVGIRDYSRWPEKPEGWRGVTERYSERMMGLSCKVLEVLSEALGLEKEGLTKACGDMIQNIILNFYPRCPQPDLTLGFRRHTDPNTIAILLQDQVGGLQASRDGGKTWNTVQPVEGALLIIVGDHCHYLSNGRFKSADHRVVVNSDHGRLSIGTFTNPAPEATVYPLKIREGEKPVLEKPINFEEMYKRYISKDLELARLKKLGKEQQLQGLEKDNPVGKPLEETSHFNPFVFWRGVR